MDFDEIGHRIDIVVHHEPREGRAIVEPIGFAQMIGLRRANPRDTHHEIRHFTINLIEQAHVGRIKRIVEVKDPSVDMLKIGF